MRHDHKTRDYAARTEINEWGKEIYLYHAPFSVT